MYLNIGLDIDNVVCSFMTGFLQKAKQLDCTKGLPSSWETWTEYFQYNGCNSFSTVWDNIKNDYNFWLELPTLEIPLFNPIVYATARPIPSEITYKWLEINNLPLAEVLTVGLYNPKSQAIKRFEINNNLVLDFFVEDLYENYVELNKNGIYCYLLDRPWNRKYEVGRQRIYSLKELI